MNDPQRLLRNTLRANGAFSALSGLVFVFGAGSVAQAIGLGDPRILVALGVGLLSFAGLLAFVSSRPRIHLPSAVQIVGADLAWVAGSVPVVLLEVLNRTGAIAVVALANVVLVFALLQYLAVHRIRATAAAPGTAS